MACNKCGEKPKKSCGAFPKAVIEIDNPEQIVLIRKVLVPASMGDESTFPPAIGKYHNVLLEYEASGGVYLYSSDGIPTKLSSDVTELQAQLNALRVRVGEEEVARADADTALSNRITSLDNSLATVAKTGSYNDLSNKPTIGNATLTIKRNGTNVGTFTANATTNKSIDIAVPTKTSDLTNDGSDGTSTYVEADELPTVDRVYSASSHNAIANSTVTNSLNRDVMTNLALDTNPSTTTINLNNVKTNLANPSSSTTTSIPLPVASSTQAGVMNSATFDAVTNNTNNINAIMNGAVAISNLPASPTQAQLTTAWENETGLTSLINRASVYDVTNNKVWTYYTNDQTWHAASNTSQVTVNTFTNSSAGTIKGSTNDGQVFAENDGTGSVNGWDTLTGNVASNTSKLATIEQGAEVNVQANWSQTDMTADDYIKNKPTIPTVNNATLTIQKNGTNVQTFTANSSTNKTANITVPTAVSELTNDANYATTTQLNSGLATKQDTLTAGDNIQINGNAISATDTTYTAGNAIDITNGEISADIHPSDFFTAEDTVSDCGSDLSLDDTMASTLRSVELRGDTFQQTYAGKNLSPYPYTDGDSKVIRGITFTAASDGSVTLNGTNDGNGNSAYYIYYGGSSTLQFEAGTYHFIPPSNTSVGYVMYDGTSYYDFSDANNYSQTFTSAKNIRDVYIQVRRGNTTVFNNLKVYPMLTTSPNPTESDYEPYVGGIPSPNPEYPQEVKVVTGEQTVEVTGKNLFPTVSQTSSSTGITIARNSDGTYNISGTATSEFNALSWVEDLSAFADGQTYTLSVSEQVGDLLVLVDMYNGNTWLRSFPRPGGTTLSRTAALDLTNATKIKFSLRVQSGKTVNLTNLAVQFEEGTATDYQPYQSQSYKINLGKNIWSSSMEVGGISSAGADLSNNRRVRSKTKVVVRPGTTYTLSAIPRDSGKVINVAVQGWTSNDTFISQITGADWQTLPLTFTTPENCYKITLNGRYSDDTVFGTVGESTNAFLNIQLEVGTNATEYAPPFAAIELYKIGDYQDYIYKSGDDWYLHKEVGKRVLDGTESWSLGQSLTNTSHFVIGDFTTLFIGAAVPPDDTVLGYCLSDHFEEKANLYNIDQAGIDLHANKNLIISVPNSVATLTADFKSWLSTHNTTVYYALETPTNTQITGAGPIAQLNALAEARSYNDQTNIIVTTAGENLPATLCVEAYRKSLEGVIEAIDNACTCGEKATHLVLSNPTTATWTGIGSVAIPYPSGAAVGMGTFASTDVVFTKDDGTTMTVGDLYTALTNGKSFEIDLPFDEINKTCYRGSDYAAIVAAAENAKLDGSSKQTFTWTSLGILSEMYASSVPVTVRTSLSRYMLLDERFGVEYSTVDDDGTVTSGYRFVVNTYQEFAPPN